MPDGEDLLWKASVIDDTFTFFQRFDQNLERIASASEASFRRVDDSVRGSGKELGFVAGVVGGLTTKLVELGMQAVASIKGFLQSSMQLRARVDTLGVALNQVGGLAGYTSEQLAGFEKEVKDAGITTRNARQSLLQMAQAELDLSKAAEIARVAQNAAVIAGVNSSEAFQRIITSVQRLDTTMLRMLGITIDAQKEYSNYAKSMGIAAKELDGAAKQQILFNAVLEKGKLITGTYEAAMGSVGKQITSLPRYIEELQLAFGAAFQPAMSAQIGWTTDRLKELLKWVQENEAELQRFGKIVGTVITGLYETLGKIVDFVVSMPGMIEEAGSVLAKAVGQLLDVASPEEIDKRRSKLGEYAAQTASLLAAGLAMVGKAVTEFIGMIGDAFKAFLQMMHLMKGDWGETVDKLNARLDSFSTTLGDTFDKAILGTGVLLGALEEVPEELDKTKDAVNDTSDALNKMAEATAAVHAEMAKLVEKVTKEAAERAKQEARAAEIEAIRLSHQIEDIERSHADRLENLASQLAKRRETETKRLADQHLKLEQGKNEKLIDIEIAFRRRLQDIVDNFDFEAEDAARRNDAITMLRLMREKVKQIREAEKARERDREDASRNFQKQEQELRDSIEQQKVDLDAWYQEQLLLAEEQRRKDYEGLERSLTRKAEIEAVQRRHAAEDRAAAYREELEKLAAHFAGIEGMTSTHLAILLKDYEKYFGDLSFMRDIYTERQSQFQPAETEAQPVPTPRPKRTGDRPFNRIIGQAGQVSQVLAGGAGRELWRVPLMSQVPAVQARTGRQVIEHRLSGDVSGLDPHIQRMLVVGLLEEERNRG